MLHFRSFVSSFFVASALLLALNGCSGSTFDPNHPLPHYFDHIVIIVQENRTPDNLFHDPALIARGADIASSGKNSHGQIIQLQPIALTTKFDLSHIHKAFVTMYNKGRMDGADLVPVECSSPKIKHCSPSRPQFTYVNAADVEPYFEMAEEYAFADRMFQSNQGPSYPAHQFLLSGTSAPVPGSNLFVAELPTLPENAGCNAPPDQRVALINPFGIESLYVYPCFEHATLTDLLGVAGITWRYYAPNVGSIWTAPNAIKHICQPRPGYSGEPICSGILWSNVVIPQTKVLNDIANNQLANVSWVIPSGQASDHPFQTNGSGPSWVAAIVNAIGNSKYWSNTAIFVTWDDWGGFYDHVAPKIYSSYEYGFRVPLIVISPYTKTAYVSHVTHDFGSILRFVEENFDLPSLHYADSRADDLTDCFDFRQTPLAFHTITAPLPAAYFLQDKTPPLDPDDDD
jgi:phospholipase C